MAKTLVLSFIATDKPGLVDRLTATVANAGGNWLESRMAHLAEKFAGVARVSVPDAKAGELAAALDALAGEGFHIVVEAATDALAAGGPVLVIDFVGPDHLGILHEISHCLAERGVSVENMKTELEPAPMGGGMLFHAKGRVRMPGGLEADALRDALEDLAEALMVDISLEADAG
ncbi:MAG: ACT domain-containing protein [Rhodospirillaceae bacterium]